MDLAERITWGLAGLTVVLVIVCATGVFGLFAVPFTSAISDEAVAYDQSRLDALMKLERGFTEGEGDLFPRIQIRPGPGPAAAGSARRPGGTPPPGAPGAPPPVDGGPGGPGPEPGAPAPYEPGLVVPYARAYDVYIPESAREKYQHFEDIRELGMTAEGWPVNYGGQEAWQLGRIEDGSALKDRLGFQEGDIIISVNGYPASSQNARTLYETLRNERSFEVLIDRQGSKIMVPYQVR